jgi:hypothetical protein
MLPFADGIAVAVAVVELHHDYLMLHHVKMPFLLNSSVKIHL